MIRGISFKVSQTFSGRILFDILNFLDLEDYVWYNVKDQSETWANMQGDEFLNMNTYSGTEFKNLVLQPHYIVFVKLQAYFYDHNFYNIKNYTEFCQSDCQLLILVSDCDYIEIYVKDDKLVKNFYEFIVDNKSYIDVTYITDLNDTRTNLNVL